MTQPDFKRVMKYKITNLMDSTLWMIVSVLVVLSAPIWVVPYVVWKCLSKVK